MIQLELLIILMTNDLYQKLKLLIEYLEGEADDNWCKPGAYPSTAGIFRKKRLLHRFSAMPLIVDHYGNCTEPLMQERNIKFM